jgi:hypothetical protein
MHIHHSTNIPKKLQILTYCIFVNQITGAFFGQSVKKSFGFFCVHFSILLLLGAFSKITLFQPAKAT